MMKQHLLLVMLLSFCIASLTISEIHATSENLQLTENITNSNPDQSNTENITNSTSYNEETSSIQNSTDQNDSTKEHYSSVENVENNSTVEDDSLVQNSTEAAGSDTYDNVHGIWLHSYEVDNINVEILKKSGITDLFVKVNLFTEPTYQKILNNILQKVKDTGIRVHAWITCFKDADGNWIDPQGRYSYQVKIPYTEVVKIPYKVPYKIKVKIQYNIRYKSWYKSYYKYKEKWKYTWKYTWKNKVAYKWTYKWTYKWAYKSVTKTSYRYETRYGYDATHTKKLLAAISDITKNYEIAGIHLDYVRYSGVGNNAAYKHPKGTETITNFVKNVYNTVKSIKQKVAVSAALMPEGSVNAYYYGQDYGQLSKYLDFLVPMIYKGNYGQNTAWIGSTTKYIVDHANGKPVVAGIQTYRSDKDLTSLSADELRQDIKAAMDKGAAGYVLFRLGLIDQNFFNSDNSVVPSDPPNDNSNNLTLEQIQIAATTVKNYVESNGRLPEYVQISTKQISMPQFAKILIISVLQLEQGIKTPIKISDIGAAPDPNGDLIDGNINDLIDGNINKSEYLDLAQRIRTFMESEGRAPNYAISSLGKIRFEYLVYNYAKIIDFYKSNQRLPNYTIFESWRMNFIPSDLELYLKPTNNCQSDNAAIKALASSITKGLNLTYDKADAIFKWVRDNCSYTFYYNTKYGAVEMSNRLNGNCIDHSHLIVALARATGIPARYGHAQCEFTTMTVGHVWADLYVNGKWYTADATSSRNSLGSMNNCKILYMKGNYIELPF